jgi:hypothetical protein
MLGLRRHLKTAGFVIIAIAGVAAIFWIVGTSKIFGECIKQSENDQRYGALQQGSAFILRLVARVHLNTDCAWEFTDNNQGPLTALATVIIATFTVFLALATRGLQLATRGLQDFAKEQAGDMKNSIAEASRAATAMENVATHIEISATAAINAAASAQKSVTVAENALVAVETPYLLPIIVGHTISVTGDGWIEDIGLGEAIKFRFHNIGRTPAILMNYYSCPIMCLGLPDVIGQDLLSHHIGFNYTEVVRAGGKSNELTFGLNDGLYRGIFEGKFGPSANKQLWFVGQCRYIDLFGNEFVSGFCFAHNGTKNYFYLIGGERYNYRRRIEREPISKPDK